MINLCALSIHIRSSVWVIIETFSKSGAASAVRKSIFNLVDKHWDLNYFGCEYFRTLLWPTSKLFAHWNKVHSQQKWLKVTPDVQNLLILLFQRNTSKSIEKIQVVMLRFPNQSTQWNSIIKRASLKRVNEMLWIETDG